MRGISTVDIRRYDLPLLISLDALLDELNVTRAARRLNISQPALSGQLAKLRDLFDDPLLVPAESGRGMVPTHRALELKPRLAEALRQLQAAVMSAESFEPASARRTFVIAANDSVFTILGIPVLTKILGYGNPNLRISFLNSPEDALVDRLERGEVDLFLGDESRVPDALKSRFLLEDNFQMAQRIGHARGIRPASLDEYCALKHVLVSQRGHFDSHIDELLSMMSRSRTVAATVPSYNQVALVLANSDCVATLPGRLLKRYRSILSILPAPIQVPAFRLSMAWHPRAQTDTGHQWLRSQLSAVADLPDSET
jgi:DNA-binding transcriptional LysR family regulator